MHETHIPSIIPFRTGRPLRGAGLLVLAVLVLLGVAGVLAGAFAGETQRVWQSLLINWLFWSSIALGMVVFAAALHMTEADWAWAVRRTAMAGVGFLPVAFVLFIVVLFGYEVYFQEWLAVASGAVDDPIVERKLPWLNMPFLVTRNLIGVAILFGLALWFVYLAIRPDVYGAGDARQQRFADWITRGWRGVPQEAARSRHLQNRIAPVFAILFAILWGMVAIDMVKSMDAHWFSTMFPVTFFVTAFLGGIAATCIATTWHRQKLGLEAYITRATYHDLGKLLFAFAVFWMYINWSQYIVIWYGLWTFEQSWVIDRLTAPYSTLVMLVILLVFALPFFGLLARPPKKVPAIVAMFAGFVLVGHWLERYLLVVPSIWPRGEALPLGLIELSATVGFGALFVISYLYAASRIPLLPSPATLAARRTVVESPEVTAGPAGTA